MFELRQARLKGLPLPEKAYLKGLQKLEANPQRTLDAIDKLAAMGTWRFQFGGNGEPFFHSHALEFMRHATREGGYCVVNTNGTLLDRPKMDELTRLGVGKLRITTMAGTAKTWVRTHPGFKETMFDALENNLIYLSEKKKSEGLIRPEVTLVCVIIAQNCDGLLDFAKFAGRIQADEVVYALLDDVGDPGLAALMPTAEEAACAREQLDESRIYLDSRGIKHNVSNALRVFRRKLNTKELYRNIPCYLGWLALRIDLDGSVYPCCRCYDSLGNIYEQDFEDIWNSEAYSRWRKEAKTINKRKTPVENCTCNVCVHHNINTRVYKSLHPVRGRSSRLTKLYLADDEGIE
jgi:radical SAM protein with 4Fe4S-binding SPASM domain